MNNLYKNLLSDGYSQVKLIGVGKSQHMSSLGNWTNPNDASVCADGDGNPEWNNWSANQRDLFVLDFQGNLILQQNITGGLPSNLESLVIGLISDIPDCDPDLSCGEAITCCDGLLYPTTCCSENCDVPIGQCNDCDPDLMCGQAITCCNGLLYPTTCCSENCDEPIGQCECSDGEVNNDNPCNPMECYNGQWVQIVIDCAEQMGVPCQGGVYIQPPEGVCCSICVQYGDSNNDGGINILDVVTLVNYVLAEEYNQVSDMNGDGILNVLDIVSLISVILE